MLNKIRQWLIGIPKDPFSSHTHRSMALIAFFAWMGLGADGLSSACYGPEEAFLALGAHYHLALYLSIITTITVFIIALAYNQVIELFPSGGGYKVASELLGPYPGLIAGGALIVDYTLTIAISVASGADALFSLLPMPLHAYKLHFEVAVLIVLIILNLRGVKESIKVLMPIFLGFLITHIWLIIHGIAAHGQSLPQIMTNSIVDSHSFISSVGWLPAIAFFLRAYSLGGGTYTGLEAVANNVHMLAPPRIRTAKWTMFYMAFSLSFTAGGIILLYLLWNVKPVLGQTLNATVFQNILADFPYQNIIVLIVLCLEASLLFAAANTGFLGGPAVLANMSIDGWTPKRFRNLSSRLVTQNGILVFGLFAAFILLWTNGDVSTLIVLYSMNVFLTFSLSLLGLCIYWWRHKTFSLNWFYQMFLSFSGFIVCSVILLVILFEKFASGGWLTVLITSGVVTLCYFIKRHYQDVNKQLNYLDKLLTLPVKPVVKTIPTLDPLQATAVLLVGKSIGESMHTLLSVQRLFPNQFKNFIFLSVGVVDVGNYGSEKTLNAMREKIEIRLKYFVDFAHQHGFAATSFSAFDNDPIKGLIELAEKTASQFSNCIFFAASMISKHENWFHRRLHSEVPTIIQRHLHMKGLQLVILPVKLER